MFRCHDESIDDGSIHNLNAEGAVLLQQGRNKEAIVCFVKGLKSILKHLDEALSPAQAQKSLGFSGQCTTAASTSPSPSSNGCCKRLLRSTTCYPSACDADDVFILYNRTLEVVLEDDAHRHHHHEEGKPCCFNPTELYGSFMPGVVMYNMGLALHLQGIQQGRSQKLTEAMQVYYMAYSSLRDMRHSNVHDEYRDLYNLALLASINNIAHICAHFRNLAEASRWSQALSTVLSESLAGGACQSSSTTISTNTLDEEYVTFFKNVCFFEKSFLSAPAA